MWCCSDQVDELSFRLSSPNCDTKIGQRLKVIYYSSSCNLLDSRRRSAALLFECQRFCVVTFSVMSRSPYYFKGNYVGEARSTLQAPTAQLTERAAPEPRAADSVVSCSNAAVSVRSEGPYRSCRWVTAADDGDVLHKNTTVVLASKTEGSRLGLWGTPNSHRTVLLLA